MTDAIESLSLKLIEISNNKYEILQHVLQLTQRQNEEIIQNQPDKFLALCQEKQHFIEKTNELDLLFEKQYDSIKELAGDDYIDVISTHMQLKELQKTIIQIKRITEEIVALEASNKDGYKKMLNEVKKLIKHSVPNVQQSISLYKKMNSFKKEKINEEKP